MKIERIGDGLVRIYGAPWVRCIARRAATCHATGAHIEPGVLVYRQVSNSSTRWWRILATVIDGQPTNGH